jgi:NAD+ synthase (glutamine-hydrolysing)
MWEQGLVAVDLDLPAAGSDLTGDVDAKDGTTMHVDRVVLEQDPVPAYQPLSAGIALRLTDEAEVWGALVTATRDYVEKNGFASVVLGLSGGIDSAVVATIAADALGPQRVHVVGMPSAWSSQGSIDDARELAELQGLHWQQISIAPMVEAYCTSTHLEGLALENLQARVRGTLLMALSNQHGHLVLTTGNKSELATGFSTLYGDSAGGFAPLKDVPKTLVWSLARWRNTVSPAIPVASIDKPPSAELAPGQLDSDRLPPYPVLDALLDAYVEQDLGRAELVAAGFDAELVDRVTRLVDTAEYKRRQYPPGPKITPRAFGRDRRLPITSRWR